MILLKYNQYYINNATNFLKIKHLYLNYYSFFKYMSDIHPGMEISRFTTQDGREVILRYPSWGDEEGMRSFINTISKEDTFITFSGEQVSIEDEKAYLEKIFQGMDEQDFIVIIGICDDQVVASASVERVLASRLRSRHTATFGITVASDFRGVGLGKALAETVISQAVCVIPELRIVKLSVYSENQPAIELYKKIGFQEYGRLPEGVYYRGRYIDQIEMYKKV